ncbi:MAG: YraN family protein [Chloroflexi bacterium]|nr:MAG: YraN family protein [Chloroflexota bacterium]
MDKRKQTGQRGEDIAAAYFQAQGYTIIRRNWRCATGELDIIMERDDTLVFVEVRTRTGSRYGTPEESITPAKQARLIELAHAYLQETGAPHHRWRIDVAAVRLNRGVPTINHLENAVGW